MNTIPALFVVTCVLSSTLYAAEVNVAAETTYGENASLSAWNWPAPAMPKHSSTSVRCMKKVAALLPT